MRAYFTIYELQVHPDHVHLFAGFKPEVSVSRAATFHRYLCWVSISGISRVTTHLLGRSLMESWEILSQHWKCEW
ncbi:MAG: hypothetical protein DRO92_03040 [Candidatus Altiarchaeales archaeon]|nr:MAG: hypothetical protein DRO92_03040 [Candidatus Altiarchaeales archaeon]